MKRLWAPWRLEFVKAASGDDPLACIFCATPATDDDRETLIVHRGETCFVILNLYPYTNGHLLIAPYRHVASPGELDARERAELWELLDHALKRSSERSSHTAPMRASTSGAPPALALRATCTSTSCHAGTGIRTSCLCSQTRA